jgi:hypothetical protein
MQTIQPLIRCRNSHTQPLMYQAHNVSHAIRAITNHGEERITAV